MFTFERRKMGSLKHRLKRAGVTLKEVADETGASQSTISHILNETLSSKIMLGAEKLLQERRKEVMDEGFFEVV
tara:strand:- start:405 stop:626 length:222 start_codon:yes stop_codon:yes gene_type:complete